MGEKSVSLLEHSSNAIQGGAGRGRWSDQDRGNNISCVPLVNQTPHGHFAQIPLTWGTDLEGGETPMSQIKKLTLKEDKELGPSSLLGLQAELKFTLRLVQLQSPCSWTSRSWLLLTFLESLSSQIKTLYPGLLLCCHLLPVTCWAGLSLVMVSSHLDLVLFFLFPSGQVAIKSWF